MTLGKASLMSAAVCMLVNFGGMPLAATADSLPLGAYGSGYDLVVAISDSDDCGPNYDQVCLNATLQARAKYEFEDEDAYTDTSVSLKSVAGDRVPLAGYSDFVEGPSSLDPGYDGYYITQDTRSALPAGSYQARVHFEQPGHWECSIYDPDGCSWSAKESWTTNYKFRWNGTSKVIQPVYRAPITAIGHRKWRSQGRRVSTSGVVTARQVDEDYTLAPSHGLPSARVKLLAKYGHQWRLIRTTRTKSNGRYGFKWKDPYYRYYKVVVVGTKSYPRAAVIKWK